jgi:hypothetical protein
MYIHTYIYIVYGCFLKWGIPKTRGFNNPLKKRVEKGDQVVIPWSSTALAKHFESERPAVAWDFRIQIMEVVTS